MRYAVLIYTPEADASTPTSGDASAMMAEYAAFTQLAIERGVMRAGEALQPSATATTVRLRDGQTLLTDGPYAETKEQLGGFYVFDCRDIDEALELAARIPGARQGTIEVRPILELSAGSAPAAEPAGAAAGQTH